MVIPNETIPGTLDTETQARAFQRVEGVLKTNFHNPDIQAVKVVLACVAAHRIPDHPPVWPLLIAAPGSMKTATLESLKGLPSTHFVDEVTANTFISGKIDERGKRRQQPASLLHRIGREGILVCADFGTVMNMNRRVRDSVIAQLRRIYDGHLSREFGTDENLSERTWEGRLTLLAASTPAIDRYYAILQDLGERFIRVRWARAGGVNAAHSAMRQTGETHKQLCDAVHSFLLPAMTLPVLMASTIQQESLDQIASLSELIVCARASVPRDRTGSVIGEPIVESNTRFPQQLAQVARGWAALSGRTGTNADDFELVWRAAWDSIPSVRSAVLKALGLGVSPYGLGLQDETISRALGDLKAIGLAEKCLKGWGLSPSTVPLLQGALNLTMCDRG